MENDFCYRIKDEFLVIDIDFGFIGRFVKLFVIFSLIVYRLGMYMYKSVYFVVYGYEVERDWIFLYFFLDLMIFMDFSILCYLSLIWLRYVEYYMV